MPVPSFYAFNQLPLDTRIGLVIFEGTFLCNRSAPEGSYINLYHIGDFFAELYYDAEMNKLHNCRAFRSISQLEAYTHLIDLPDL